MRITRCETSRHFYDSDLHEACPQCMGEQGASVPIKQDTVFCTGCGKSMAVTKQFCSNCGKKLKATGAPLQPVPQPQPETPPEPQPELEPEPKDEESVPEDDKQEPYLTGWLVCTRGELRGQDFALKSGQYHADCAQSIPAVSFDPAGKVFHIQPGEGVCLNGRLVEEDTLLSAYDKLELGDAEFVFVPFCGDSFSWSEHITISEAK